MNDKILNIFDPPTTIKVHDTPINNNYGEQK